MDDYTLLAPLPGMPQGTVLFFDLGQSGYIAKDVDNSPVFSEEYLQANPGYFGLTNVPIEVEHFSGSSIVLNRIPNAEEQIDLKARIEGS